MSGQLIALLVPLVVIQVSIQIFALRDLIKRRQVVGNNKWLWAAVILLGGLLGPLVYLLAGRKEE